MFHLRKYSKTLKPLFERDWNLYNIILSQDNFESDCPEAKFQTITAQRRIAEIRTVIFNEMINDTHMEEFVLY